ncbi:hypothetical protein [Agromyces laixinhei]|uniref:hypothetical protein n=1 Tax=Agromyces laixinhei TaxID=2585717 RepID=UPI001E5A4FC6|nr:hypothetical protein [Agromyces laixinhei]
MVEGEQPIFFEGAPADGRWAGVFASAENVVDGLACDIVETIAEGGDRLRARSPHVRRLQRLASVIEESPEGRAISGCRDLEGLYEVGSKNYAALFGIDGDGIECCLIEIDRDASELPVGSVVGEEGEPPARLQQAVVPVDIQPLPIETWRAEEASRRGRRVRRQHVADGLDRGAVGKLSADRLRIACATRVMEVERVDGGDCARRARFVVVEVELVDLDPKHALGDEPMKRQPEFAAQPGDDAVEPPLAR